MDIETHDESKFGSRKRWLQQRHLHKQKTLTSISQLQTVLWQKLTEFSVSSTNTLHFHFASPINNTSLSTQISELKISYRNFFSGIIPDINSAMSFSINKTDWFVDQSVDVTSLLIKTSGNRISLNQHSRTSICETSLFRHHSRMS